MYLRNSRVLWLKLSPLAHATVTTLGRTAPRMEAAVIGPAQFGDLATAPADRLLVLNQKLAGPSVWRGGDLAIAVGLFAVPRDQAAVALLDTLSQVASLAVPGLSQGLELAKIVKSGVEGVIGLSKTKPVLAVKDALQDPTVAKEGSEAAPCVIVGVAAAQADVDFAQLWVKDGRLWQGTSVAALTPYEEYDHLIVAIERGPAREDWRGLPGLTPYEAAFDAVLRTPKIQRADAEAKLNEAFGPFDSALNAEPELTLWDKERIRGAVIADLQVRLNRLTGPFGKTAAPSATTETRSVAGVEREVSMEGFDFANVPSGGVEAAKPAPSGSRPF
jgi:hypothetical protein